jgi:hypothetical protein
MQHPALQRQDVARHPCAQLSPGLAGSWGWRTAMADSVADGNDRRRAAAPHEDSHSAEMLLTHLRNQVGLSRTLCGTRLNSNSAGWRTGGGAESRSRRDRTVAIAEQDAQRAAHFTSCRARRLGRFGVKPKTLTAALRDCVPKPRRGCAAELRCDQQIM